jgi:hypothetical protein
MVYRKYNKLDVNESCMSSMYSTAQSVITLEVASDPSESITAVIEGNIDKNKL